MFGVHLVIFCGIIGFLDSFPVDCNEPIVVALDAISPDDLNHSKSDDIQDAAVSTEANENPEYNDLIIRPMFDSSDYFNSQLQHFYFQDDGQTDNGLFIDYGHMSPLSEIPYEVDNEDRIIDVMNFERRYDDDRVYPLVHSSVSAALNPEVSVNLSPTFLTQIHESIPLSSYDVADDGSGLLLSNFRPVRSRLDDQILAELTHEALMPNILPTMDVPFNRQAGERTQKYQVPQPPVVAEYPTGSPNGCAIPIRLGCSPTVHYGTLTDPNVAKTKPVEPVYRKKSSG